MRKAAGLGKRGSRKKQPNGPPDPSGERTQPTNNIIPPEPSHPPAMEMQYRRKPSGEEAALTSKNYRLAKELSELRVRHREECKNVTRLTMENMNLASRCREAISHVAMLKKELAMHQRMAAESLALQREQTQRMAADITRLSQSASEEDDNTDSNSGSVQIERILASLPPPPPPPKPPLKEPGKHASDTAATTSTENPSPSDPSNGEASAESHQSHTVSPSHAEVSPKVDYFADPTEDGGNNVRRTVSPPDDQSSSPLVDEGSPSNSERPQDYDSNDALIGDDNRDEPKGLTLFPYTASPKPYSARDYNEEFPSDMLPVPNRHPRRVRSSEDSALSKDSLQSSSSAVPTNPSFHTSGSRRDPATLDSIHAFEASFDTTFPDTFSPRDGELNKKNGPSNSTYNPFVASPGKATTKPADSHESGSSTPSARVMEGGADQTQLESSPVRIRGTLPTAESPQTSTRASQPLTPQELNVNPSEMDAARYMTPPRGSHPVPVPQNELPKRPEKMVPESARARYEKALYPRTSDSLARKPGESNQPTFASAVDPSDANGTNEGSPSRLLSRVHQRRFRQHVHRNDPHMALVQHDIGRPPESIREQHALGANTVGSISERPFDEIEGDPSHNQSRMENDHDAFSRIPPEPQAAPSRLPEGSMEADIKALDAMRSQYAPQGGVTKSSRIAALKLRRNVKQPHSYAEPSLHAKLRKGDAYFAKAENPPEAHLVQG